MTDDTYTGYRYIYHPNKFTFSKCGLNIEQNFLQAPICPCCGHKGSILLKNQEELQDFLGELLADFECHHCAVFVIRSNGNVFYMIKDTDAEPYSDDWFYDSEDEDEVYIEGYEMQYPMGVPDYTDIGDLAEMLGLHMYGLLVEENRGQYTVIEK